jgi:uncharacterized membrane protein YuzA (DUF378 family)
MKHFSLGVPGQIALWLAIIGAINWGLTALGFNLVEVITGRADWLATAIYLLVGLSGLYLAIRAVVGERAEYGERRE